MWHNTVTLNVSLAIFTYCSVCVVKSQQLQCNKSKSVALIWPCLGFWPLKTITDLNYLDVTRLNPKLGPSAADKAKTNLIDLGIKDIFRPALVLRQPWLCHGKKLYCLFLIILNLQNSQAKLQLEHLHPFILNFPSLFNPNPSSSSTRVTRPLL